MMGNPKANPAAPLTPMASPGSVEFGQNASEEARAQAREFHFAVTWVTLFAHLDPIEAAGPRPHLASPPSMLALVPVVASAPVVDQRLDRAPKAGCENAAWEMVVPKMVRTGAGSFAPADGDERGLL